MMYFRNDGWVKSPLGQAIAGASIYVCSQPADVSFLPPMPEVQLYADPAGATPLAQPVITDGFGHYDFYVPYGTYTVVVVNGGNVQQVYPDQTVGFTGGGGGTVTNNEGTLTAGQLVLGNGGSDIMSGPAFPGDPTKFLNGTGAFSVPAGGGSGTVTHTSGPLTLNAVILGNSGADIQAGTTLPGSALVYLDGTGNFSTPTSGGNFTKIAEVITSSSVPTISFTGIPGTYRNLRLSVTARTDDTNPDIYLQFNGDTGANYSYAGGYVGASNGNLIATGVSQASAGTIAISSAPSNQPGACEIVINDYARTAWKKCTLANCNRMDSSTVMYFLTYAMTWNNTAVINAILIGKETGAGNFVSGSIFTLYGES